MEADKMTELLHLIQAYGEHHSWAGYYQDGSEQYHQKLKKAQETFGEIYQILAKDLTYRSVKNA